MKKDKNLINWLNKQNNLMPPSKNWAESQKAANKLCQANLKNLKTNSWLLSWLRKTKKTSTLKLPYSKERWKTPKMSETYNSKSKNLMRENSNLTMKLKESNKKKSHLKSNIPKSSKLLIRKMLLLMAWKKTLTLIKKSTWKKRKNITRNGNNGRKPRRKDLMKHNKKSRNSINRLINSGMTSAKTKKLTGNKNTMLIGSNGKWRSKVEKLTTSKEKREDFNMNKKIKNMKNKKSFRSTSVKSNCAINWYSTLTTSRSISTEGKKIRTKRKRPLMSLLNWLLTLNGKRKKLKFWFQRNLKLMRTRDQLKRVKRTKKNNKKKIKSKNSIFHTQFRTNSNHWKFWPHLQSRKLRKKLKSWEKERNFSREAVLKSKCQKKIQSYWLRSRQRSLQVQDK